MAIDIANLEDAALVRSLYEQQRSLVRSRFALSMNRLENTAGLRVIRKDIARIQTEIRLRELAAGLPKDQLLRNHPVDLRSVEAGEGKGKSDSGLLAGVVDKLGG